MHWRGGCLGLHAQGPGAWKTRPVGRVGRWSLRSSAGVSTLGSRSRGTQVGGGRGCLPRVTHPEWERRCPCQQGLYPSLHLLTRAWRDAGTCCPCDHRPRVSDHCPHASLSPPPVFSCAATTLLSPHCPKSPLLLSPHGVPCGLCLPVLQIFSRSPLERWGFLSLCVHGCWTPALSQGSGHLDCVPAWAPSREAGSLLRAPVTVSLSVSGSSSPSLASALSSLQWEGGPPQGVWSEGDPRPSS